jgi:hypothetical protein
MTGVDDEQQMIRGAQGDLSSSRLGLRSDPTMAINSHASPGALAVSGLCQKPYPFLSLGLALERKADSPIYWKR